MATEPDRRLRRKAGEKELPVYYGNMDDQKDAEYESDSSFSESSAAISVASSKEEHLREVEDAASEVRKLAQFSDLTYVRCTLDVAGAPGSEHPARRFERRDRRTVLNIVRSREDERHGADTADHGWGDRSAEGCRCRARSSPTCSCRSSRSPEQACGVLSGADSICSSYFVLCLTLRGWAGSPSVRSVAFGVLYN